MSRQRHSPKYSLDKKRCEIEKTGNYLKSHFSFVLLLFLRVLSLKNKIKIYVYGIQLVNNSLRRSENESFNLWPLPFAAPFVNTKYICHKATGLEMVGMCRRISIL